MALLRNCVPKCFRYTLVFAVFFFLWMFHYSSNYSGNIFNRDITSNFTGPALNTEQYNGPEEDAEIEFSIVESFNETSTYSLIPSQESTLFPNTSERTSNDSIEPKMTGQVPAISSGWWNAMLKRQAERKLHLRQVCETKYKQFVLPLTEFVKDKRHLYSFYYIDKFKLMYSFAHKVGSTNWARLLRKVSKSHRLKRLYRLPRHEALWRLQNFTSFIVVRHPLVRLLSAYRDKFIEHHIPHYKSVGRTILKKFRKGVTKKELIQANSVQFEEFLNYIVASRKHQGNTHWDHSILRNRVCVFDYDIIGKLETIEEDTKFILKTFKLDRSVNFGAQYQNYTGQQEIIRSFYSKIPQKLLDRVIHAYESDMLLFNYSMGVP